MIQQGHINKIQTIIFMQRLYAYLLILRYFEFLSKTSGNKTSQTDVNGNKTSQTDSLGNITQYAYGGASAGGCASCGTSGTDQLTSITDTKGHTTTFTYNTLNLNLPRISGHTEKLVV